MKPLFTDFWSIADDLIAQHVNRLGLLPKAWWETWAARSQFFDVDGLPVDVKRERLPLEQAFEARVQQDRRELSMGEFGEEETRAILDLIRRMLAFRPEERPTCEEILESEWMLKWALPELQRTENAALEQ